MECLAEHLKELNIGQVLMWGDGDNDYYGVISDIHIDREHELTHITTAHAVHTYGFGEIVETRMSPELRMTRLIMNVAKSIEHSTTGEEVH